MRVCIVVYVCGCMYGCLRVQLYCVVVRPRDLLFICVCVLCMYMCLCGCVYDWCCMFVCVLRCLNVGSGVCVFVQSCARV